MNYCKTVSSIFSVYLLGNTKKTNTGWLHRLYLIDVSWTIFENYCQTISSIFSVYLLGNTKKTNIGWIHRLYLIGTSLGGLWVIAVLVHERRCAGHFSPRGELSVIVVIAKGWRRAEYFLPLGELSVIVIIVKGRRRTEHFSPRGELLVIVIIVNGWRCAGHFSPRGELLVIVVLVNAEPDGANHLVMQNRNQMPTPLLGCLIAMRLHLVTLGPLPLAHSHECNLHRVRANGQQRHGAVGWLWQHDEEVGWLWLSEGRCNRLFDGRRNGRRNRRMGSGGM